MSWWKPRVTLEPCGCGGKGGAIGFLPNSGAQIPRDLCESRRKASFPLVIFSSRARRTTLCYQLSQSAALRESEPSNRKHTAHPCARLRNGSAYQRKDNVVGSCAARVID